MRNILEKFPSDFRPKKKQPADDQGDDSPNAQDQDQGSGDADGSGEQDDREQDHGSGDGSPAPKKNPFKKGDGEEPADKRSAGDDRPVTLRDLKKLIAMKSHDPDADGDDDEDEDGADKSVTDTGDEPNVIKKEPVVR